MKREQLEHARRDRPARRCHRRCCRGVVAIRGAAWQAADTAAPSGEPRFTGWCLEPHDLCAAKLCAGREKDLNFVRALLGAGLIAGSTVAARLASVPSTHGPSAQRAAEWLASTNG
jgi:hypothetical protein